MLQQLTIENFIKIPFLDIRPEQPVVFFAGHNEVGKTTVAESVRFVLRGENPRIEYKRDRQKLLTNGASKGHVTLQWDNVTVKRNIKDGKAFGDTQYLPTNELITDVCLQAAQFAKLGDTRRRQLTMEIAEVDLSVDKVSEKLVEKGATKTEVKKYRPLLMSGIKDAHAHAKRGLTDARGAWKEVTGETYGSSKAAGWKPEQAVISNGEEISQSIAEIDTDIAKLKSERDAELAAIRESINKKTAPLTAKISEYEQLLKKPKPLACPHCGGAVLIANGEVIEFTGEEVQKKRIEALQTAARLKRQGLKDEERNSSEQARNNYAEQISGMEESRRELNDQLRLIEKAEGQEKRAAELHKEAVAMGRLAELLSDGPDGVAAAIIADSLRPLNERLTEIGQAIGWQHAVIHGDMSIARSDGCPYVLLSESAQWRIDAMLHALISELAEFPWLIYDRMDLLDVDNRTKFIKWLSKYGEERTDEASILVMATLKQKPNLGKVAGIELHWLE